LNEPEVGSQRTKKIFTMATKISPTVSTAGWSLLRPLSFCVLKRPWPDLQHIGQIGEEQINKMAETVVH
jgi:hypothetical protein